MLKNHSKIPGPYNRGQRSALIWDRRPINTQILRKLFDTKQHRLDEKEFGDCKDFLATHGEKIDDIFYDRDMVQLFEEMTDENGKLKEVPKVQIIM